MLLVPTRIDRYEIKGRLGAGGMGSLYLARDTNPTTDRLVVLKLLRTSFDSDELRRRFVREARALAELNHPNIVVIYDSGVFEDSPFIVMEYVRGETLAEIIRRQAPIPLGEKLRLLSELCSGLAHAHTAGIIHRDIKPANLVVDLHGRLKILDFGIARVDTDATLHLGQVTQVAMQMGTPGYMSPEQIESGEVDARSDLFAAGAVAYELLSGREAFRGANTRQIERQVLGEQPAPLASLVPGLDPAIAEIVAGALEKDVQRRCQSATELADAFDRVRSRLPEDSRLPRQTTPPPRPSGERKSRRERAADAAYERAANSYREGAEECARRFAMEAIAEAPQHAEARRLLLDLGRFRDVEPWLPPEAKAPFLPKPDDSSATVIAPLPSPEPPSPPRPSPPPPPPVVPASPTSSAGTIVATPGLGVTASGTFVVTPGDDHRPPVAGMGDTGEDTLVAQLPPKPTAPPKPTPPPKPTAPPRLSQPPKPPQGRTRPGVWRLAAGWLAGLPPVARWALIVGSLVVVVAAGAVWLLFLSGPGLETLTITPPKDGTIVGGGIRCGTAGSQCTAELARGSTAVLTAVPDPEFAFAGFSGDCTTDGMTKMDGPRRCGGSFAVKPPPTDQGPFKLTVEKPIGGTIEGDGISCGPSGSQCETQLPLGATVQLRARADARFRFAGFTGDCDAKGGTTKMDGPRTCGATFTTVEVTIPGKPAPEPSWTLTISKPMGGTIVGDRISCGAEGNSCGASFQNNHRITLSPKPEFGWTFAEFTGDCRPAGEVVMTGNRTCGARFVKEVVAPPEPGAIILVVTRPQNGTILGNGINCGPKNEECSSPQPARASVRLTASPNAGFVFAGFIGNCDANGVVVMTSSRTCGANFVPAGSSLPAATFPMLSIERSGHATVYGPGIECGSGGSRWCKAQQPAGSTVQLRVQPDSGYMFLRFGGDCDAGGRAEMTGPRKCTVLVQRTSDKPVSEQAYPTLTVIPPTGGTLLGNGIYCGTGGSACSARQPAARSVQLTARPDAKFEFIRFTGDCDASGTTMMNGPRSCGAVFRPKGGQ